MITTFGQSNRFGNPIFVYKGHQIYNSGVYFGFSGQNKWRSIADVKAHIDRTERKTIIDLVMHEPNIGESINQVFTDPLFDRVQTPAGNITTQDVVDVKKLYNDISNCIENGKLKSATDFLIKLAGECYLRDLISDKFVENIMERLDKLDKVISMISSDFDNESNVANNKSFMICEEILMEVGKEAKISDK